MRRLVLFDIDGTLLTARGAPRRAFHRAMLQVYGTAGPIATHPFDGKTDPQIARELLTQARVRPDRIQAGFPALWSVYLRELGRELAVPGHETIVMPGVRELIAALEKRRDEIALGLLTGNIAGGARLKLGSVGMDRHFAFGAFGSDAERRDALPAVAVRRAERATGREFRGRDIVVIGDTPADVLCGRSLEVRAIGVGTGRHPTAELEAAGAEHAFADLSETERVLAAILE